MTLLPFLPFFPLYAQLIRVIVIFFFWLLHQDRAAVECVIWLDAASKARWPEFHVGKWENRIFFCCSTNWTRDKYWRGSKINLFDSFIKARALLDNIPFSSRGAWNLSNLWFYVISTATRHRLVSKSKLDFSRLLLLFSPLPCLCDCFFWREIFCVLHVPVQLKSFE